MTFDGYHLPYQRDFFQDPTIWLSGTYIYNWKKDLELEKRSTIGNYIYNWSIYLQGYPCSMGKTNKQTSEKRFVCGELFSFSTRMDGDVCRSSHFQVKPFNPSPAAQSSYHPSGLFQPNASKPVDKLPRSRRDFFFRPRGRNTWLVDSFWLG